MTSKKPAPQRKQPRPPPPVSDGLTLRQRRFVQELPLARSQTEAAIRAGYSQKGETATVKASQLVRNGNVRPAIAAALAAQASTAIATQVERKTKLTELLRMPLDAPTVQPQVVIAASDQLNRMESVYVDRSMSLSANIDLTELEGFSLEELKALLAATQGGTP